MTRTRELAPRAVILAIGIAAPVLGCSSGFGPRTLKSADPAAKIPAMKTAVDQNDKASVPALVKELESDDPAVRLYAIEALKRLTGETFDYHYYDDESQRKPALHRWQQYVAEQK